MKYKVDNAVIMCAGTSSRFAPLSYERPKGLTVVRGEVLLERQIRQLQEAGVPEIWLVTGYKHEQFAYLAEKFGVGLIHNPDYLTRNNHASLRAAREVLGNSYVCSADNYFTENPFEKEVEGGAYYSAVYFEGPTEEFCMTEEPDGFINSVTIGGRDAWCMLGHVFWSREFSRKFLEILDEVYDLPETAGKLWEIIYAEHLSELPMRMRRYPDGVIYEFDSMDELRVFDPSYVDDTRSVILKEIARRLGVREAEITQINCLKAGLEAVGIHFLAAGKPYEYRYESGLLTECGTEE